jgi:hypothetical protein
MRKYYAMADMFFFRIRDFYGLHKNKVHSSLDDDSADQPTKATDVLTTSPTSSTMSSPYNNSNTSTNNNRLLDDLVGSLDDTFSLLLEQSFQQDHLQEMQQLPVLSSSVVPSLTTDWTFNTQPFFLDQQTQPYPPPTASSEPSGSGLWTLPPS